MDVYVNLNLAELDLLCEALFYLRLDGIFIERVDDLLDKLGSCVDYPLTLLQ